MPSGPVGARIGRSGALPEIPLQIINLHKPLVSGNSGTMVMVVQAGTVRATRWCTVGVFRLNETTGWLDARDSVPGDPGCCAQWWPGCRLGRIWAGAPAVDAGERAVAGDAGCGDPGLSGVGLSEPAGVLSPAALGQGDWQQRPPADAVASRLQAGLPGGGPMNTQGYRPVAVDVTGFWPGHACRGARPATTTGRPARRCQRSPWGWWHGWGASARSDWGCRSPWSGPDAADPSTVAHASGRWCGPPWRRRHRTMRWCLTPGSDPPTPGSWGDAVRRAGGEERHGPAR